jgi:ER membrane protein complex subunit 1
VLDSRNGQKLDQITLSSENDVESATDIQVELRGKAPVITWADKSRKTLKLNILGSKNVLSFPISNESASDPASSIVLHSANDVSAPSHVLVEYRSKFGHWGNVFHISSGSSDGSIDPSKATAKKAYEVARLAGQGTIAPSLADGKLFFTRVAKGAFLVLASSENEIVERSIMKDFGVPGIVDYPDPILSVGEISARTDGKTYAVRTATLIGSGDLVLISNGHGSWTRHEGLAYVESAGFAELPKTQTLAEELAIEDHASMLSAYIHRVKRHINDLKHLPKYIRNLQSTVLASITSAEPPSTVSKDDIFGFHKYVVVLTKYKRIIALDVVNHGKVVWNNQIAAWKSDAVPQMTISPQGVIRIKTEDSNSVYDISTGKLLRNTPRKDTDASQLSKTMAATVKYALENGQVVGRIAESTTPLWTFTPQPGEQILSITTRPATDPVASIGDVLGDRRVLYKYLNPNLILITATNNATHSASFYLLDAVSGNALYTTTHRSVDTTRPIPALLSENWLAYSFTVFPSPNAPSRGYQLTLSKLYESPLPDDRGPLGAATNYSSLSVESAAALTPHVVAQTFHVPEEISALAVTQTRQGITSRLLLAVLPFSGALLGIPLHALDPRRPVGRDPSKTEAEEGLVKYTPNLDFDPKWYLSHRREVLGVQHVIAAPATLESTSLVFAWGEGGDVFGTRVAPSFAFDVLGKEFNKVQMLITVGALVAAVVVVGPLVGRKGNDMRWAIL